MKDIELQMLDGFKYKLAGMKVREIKLLDYRGHRDVIPEYSTWQTNPVGFATTRPTYIYTGEAPGENGDLIEIKITSHTGPYVLT
jgi:hypothetical protein